MAKKRKKIRKKPSDPTKLMPRQPPELAPLGVFRKNLDYTSESPYHGEPKSVSEYRKRRERRLRRRKMAMTILADARSNVLVIDDDQERHNGFNRILRGANVKHVYNYDQAIDALNKQTFEVIYFDHDLADYGDSPTGYGERERTGADIALYLVRMLPRDRYPKLAVIHSLNPVGAQNIESALKPAGIRCIRQPYGEPSD